MHYYCIFTYICRQTFGFKTLPPVCLLYTQASFNILWDPSFPIKTRKTEPVPAYSQQYYCIFYVLDYLRFLVELSVNTKAWIRVKLPSIIFLNIRRDLANKQVTFNVINCVHKCFGNSISLLLQVKDSIWGFFLKLSSSGCKTSPSCAAAAGEFITSRYHQAKHFSRLCVTFLDCHCCCHCCSRGKPEKV